MSFTQIKNLEACILQEIVKKSYSLLGMLNSNKKIFLTMRLRICGVTLPGFPSTGSLRASRSHRMSCNFDFHARYARKSRKLRAPSKTPHRLLDLVSKNLRYRRSICELGWLRSRFEALHKRITYQWTDSVKNLYGTMYSLFPPTPKAQ